MIMTRSLPTPRPGISDIAPYIPGESKLADGAEPIKLSSNETPLGPSPAALKAFQSAAAEGLHRYPDGAATALRQAIARRFGLDAGRIVCGAGSDEILSLLAQAYLGPGDEAIHTEHGFLVYPIVIQTNGATPVVVRETDYRADVDAILAAASERTKIVFLANPNNPTGTYVPADEVRRLRSALPAQTLLVLDGAYAEYVRRNDYEAGIELVATTENTVMTRTFSKIYGLAALRLGWAYCPEAIADILNRIRGPFNVSGPAIAAGVKAIEDQDHVERAIQHNDQALAWLSARLSEIGLDVTPSSGNFVLVHFPNTETHSAEAADTFLKSHAIIVRRVASYGLPGALRITIGTDAENAAVATALSQFMQGA